MFDEAERRVYGELREQALAVETPVAPASRLCGDGFGR
jgi:hypothetical protein